MELLNLLLAAKFLGMSWFNDNDLFKLVIRFLFNLTAVFIIIRVLYYSSTRRKDYLFTYFLISTIIFLLCFMLDNVKVQIGFALGLFAIFGIIRYRTLQMPIKEMTYLFIIIGLSVINALANKKISWAEILFTNGVIIGIAYLLERVFLLKHESCKLVTYEKIENIKPQNREALIADLEERIGLKINRIEIGQINFLRDAAKLKVYFYRSDNMDHSADNPDDYSTTEDDAD